MLASGHALWGFQASPGFALSFFDVQPACLQNNALILDSPESQRRHRLIQRLPGAFVSSARWRNQVVAYKTRKAIQPKNSSIPNSAATVIGWLR